MTLRPLPRQWFVTNFVRVDQIAFYASQWGKSIKAWRDLIKRELEIFLQQKAQFVPMRPA